jgi:hypothetical protein
VLRVFIFTEERNPQMTRNQGGTMSRTLAVIAVSLMVGLTFGHSTAQERPVQGQSESRLGLIKRVDFGMPPIGSVMAYAGPWNAQMETQTGWMLCDGRMLKPEMHGQLIKLFNDSKLNAKNAPDYRGYFLRGFDASPFQGPAKVDAARSLGSRQEDTTRLPRTNKFKTGGDHDGQHIHASDVPNAVKHKLAKANKQGTVAGGHVMDNTEVAPLTEINLQFGEDVGPGGHGHEIMSGGDMETRPKNISVNWIIRFR